MTSFLIRRVLVVVFAISGASAISPEIVFCDASAPVLVSQDLNGLAGNGPSSHPAISAAGDLVFFESEASNLIPQDSNSHSDVFAFLSSPAALSRISESSSGLELPAGGGHPLAISGDGNLIAFIADSGMLTTQSGAIRVQCAVPGIYLRNRADRTTSELALSKDGQALNGYTYPAGMSYDGRYLVLISSATNIGTDLESGTYLVLYDTQSASSEIIQHLSSESIWDETLFEAAISADGRFIAFSGCVDQVQAPADMHIQCYCTRQIFLYDHQERWWQNISRNSNGEAADESCRSPAISADGRFVAFSSAAANLVVDPEAELQGAQIYLYDRLLASLVLASVNAAGEAANAACVTPSISATGKYLLFASNATNLVENGELSVACETTQTLFRRDLAGGSYVRLDQDSTGLQLGEEASPALSSNGLALAFVGRPVASGLSEEESADQVYLAALEGEADALVLEQPSLNRLMRQINAAISASKPVITIKGHKVRVGVQGFKTLRVKRGAKRLRKQNYTGKYEISIAKRLSSVAGLKTLREQPRQTVVLGGGNYKASYRVKVTNRSKTQTLWSRKSATRMFGVR